MSTASSSHTDRPAACAAGFRYGQLLRAAIDTEGGGIGRQHLAAVEEEG